METRNGIPYLEHKELFHLKDVEKIDRFCAVIRRHSMATREYFFRDDEVTQRMHQNDESIRAVFQLEALPLGSVFPETRPVKPDNETAWFIFHKDGNITENWPDRSSTGERITQPVRRPK